MLLHQSRFSISRGGNKG
ncbi:Protein of unknown function [Pyronema omphalodes CBS 100304]|uniref:Uncharacterized protein n=1 Tax=Pyronema omphalodes (strain CBS 100304) TaxID=1076935 RepID=U4L5Z9_PYROM|nr:Protein of unknown function [Pyronema omphalodes CBS 100304]